MFKGFEIKKVKCAVLVWDDKDEMYGELFPDYCTMEDVKAMNKLYGFTPVGRVMECARIVRKQ